MTIQQLIPLIIALPLIGGFINGVLGKKLPKVLVGSIATLAVFTSFFLAVTVFFQLDEAVKINLFTILNDISYPECGVFIVL